MNQFWRGACLSRGAGVHNQDVAAWWGPQKHFKTERFKLSFGMMCCLASRIGRGYPWRVTLLLALLTGGMASGILLAGEADLRQSFRFPQARTFTLDPAVAALPRLAEAGHTGEDWVEVQPEFAPEETWYFGNRVVVQVETGVDPRKLPGVAGRPIRQAVGQGLYVISTDSALAAWDLAALLGSAPGVRAAHPTYRRPSEPNFAYAPAPNDLFFEPQVANVAGQWYLENRNPTNGLPLGVDLNARGAWAHARGAGLTIAIADIGVELDHPDLVDRTAGAPHHNFLSGSDDGSPASRTGILGAHGTACAGLAAATANNEMPMAGMAPEASLASWVIVDRRGTLASDERLAEMFMYALDRVAVQNHSWGVPTKKLDGFSLLEDSAIQEAFFNGRAGKGVVMVRAGGNQREAGQNANDDSYANDWRAICVGAIVSGGRATPYSEPGACLLVAAPGGLVSGTDTGLFTTDLKGPDGANFIGFFPPLEFLSSYMFNNLGFIGTSAAAPLVSGIAALMLEVNPNLTARDVQQVLLLSARQFDVRDPDLVRNGAGLWTSHNTGFGVPDAGEAVRMAARWSNRPPVEIHVLPPRETPVAIPDNGLKVVVEGDGIPPELASLNTQANTGPFADDPTPWVRLQAAGPSTGGAVLNLTNSGAVMELERGKVVPQIQYAAGMGAEFVMLYNCTIDGVTPCPVRNDELILNGTDYTSIPSVYVQRTNALALLDVFRTNATARARLELSVAEIPFLVTNTLSLEHVRVRLQTDHPLRGDLRITLVSPSGTRSILQRLNDDTGPGPVDWTYMSTRHFFEPSRGEWKVAVSDLNKEVVGNVLSCGLILNGISIVDADNDGLDDGWELQYFGNLAHGPTDRVAADAYTLMRKFISGMDPRVPAYPLELDFVHWHREMGRISWPEAQGADEIHSGLDLQQFSFLRNAALNFWESSAYVPLTNRAEFFRVIRP